MTSKTPRTISLSNAEIGFAVDAKAKKNPTLVPLSEQRTPEEEKAAKLNGKKGPKSLSSLMTIPAPKKEKTPKKEKATKAEGKTPKAKKSRSVGDTDKSPAERRIMVVAAMIKLGATSATSGRTSDEIAATCGLTRFDVIGHLYYTHKLQTEGHVKQVKMEGARSLTYFLTAKGIKAKGEIA